VRDLPSPFVDFSRAEWARLRASTPLTLTADDLVALRGVNEVVAVEEVAEVYLPLSRLLNLRFAATRDLHAVTGRFLGGLPPSVPFVVGVAGSVAVGKSTFSRVLRAVLERWPDHPRVDLVTTDGFLLPNAELERRGLGTRKGFPESYDLPRLVRFLADLEAGVPELRVPVYSHVTYDVVPDEHQVVAAPDIVIVEGLNVLQAPTRRAGAEPPLVVSDFFDFRIYVDAEVADVRRWYVERFLTLLTTAFRDEASFFHHLTALSESDAEELADTIWSQVNEVNLVENIAPTRSRADLVLEKGPDHAVRRVRLRRL